MNEAIIMPTRGDREVLEKFTRERFTSLGNVLYRDISPAYHEGVDIVPRVRQLWEWTKHYEWIWIIENDDYYPIDYLDKMREFRDKNKLDWIGSNEPYYYHITGRRYMQYKFNWNSGLWNMGFRPSVLDDFLWPPDTEIFLDSWICKHVQRMDFNRGMFNKHGGIGIKGHGIGLHGSQGGHNKAMRLTNDDSDLKWLKSNTDEEYCNYIQDNLYKSK